MLGFVDSYDPQGNQRWYLTDYGLQILRAIYQIPREIYWEAGCRTWTSFACPSDEPLYVYSPG